MPLMMATSIQACLPNSCKNQHQMKAVGKSPNVVRRSSMRQQNAANRRSAVERLEESKANYVKSERVLDTKQEFKNSSHLRVSTGPHLDYLLKSPPKIGSENFKPNTPEELKLSYLRINHQTNSQSSKSPPTHRARAKSHSEFRGPQVTRKHSFASQGGRHHRIEVLIDIESQLKRLIVSGSRENVSAPPEPVVFNHSRPAQVTPPKFNHVSEITKVRRGYSDPVKKNCWLQPDVSPDADSCIHKSMPDLSPSPCNAQIPCSSLSLVGDPSGIRTSDTCDIAKCSTPQQKIVPIVKIEPDPDKFDSYHEPKRFSNGTGMLHLTPYYSASSQLRRPVSRSKSDVSHRYSKRTEYKPRRNNYTSAEIERFFDTMGLDATAWHHITSPSLVSSPPCFFESISSIDSNEIRSSVCSDDSVSDIPKEGLRNHDLRIHGPLETSIVEKNARVIKWLYNCRKATYES